MSDPSLPFIIIPAFLALLTGAAWFKTLDFALWRESQVPLIAGVACGIALQFLPGEAVPRIVAGGALLVGAALYARLVGHESEPSDGMLLGALTGTAAASTFVLGGEALRRFAELVPAGAVAGYGITFGVLHARDRLRQFAFDLLTAALAVGAAALPTVAVANGVALRDAAVTAAAVIPLAGIATVVRQWPSVRAELREEAAHGFMHEDDARTTAHPLLRLGRCGWYSAGAHREFVRIATRIALRKRQQRSRPEKVARLYQLEVIKLRMEMQEMTRIDRAMRAAVAADEPARESAASDSPV